MQRAAGRKSSAIAPGRSAGPVAAARHGTADLEPSNILVTPQGRLVILDFGIISDLQRVERWSQYRTMGTVAYMAPEQADARPVGPAADWYSVGVVLYEALTGTLPYVGQPAEILERKRRELPLSPGALVPTVPPAPAGLDDLHSGAPGVALDGTAYASW